MLSTTNDCHYYYYHHYHYYFVGVIGSDGSGSVNIIKSESMEVFGYASISF
jgi:hypothetical protein